MRRPLSEGTREQDFQNTDTTTWMTITISAFFGLVAAAEVFDNLHMDIQPVIVFVLISFLLYVGANSFRYYKALVWHQQIGETIEGIARLSFLLSIILMVWQQATIDYPIKIILTLITLSSWIIDFVTRVILWNKHFKALK
jgi:hypothetical protein